MAGVKKITATSENACHNGLNIFSVPPTDVSLNRSAIKEILPLNSVFESPYEFRVFSDNQWLDLSKTYLYLQVQIEKRDGNGWIPLAATDTNVAPIQTLGQSFIRQLKVNVNGTEVYDSSTLYPYICYMKNELGLSPVVKSTWLSAAGYYADTVLDNAGSPGFQARNNLMGQSEIVEFVSRLDFDLANQNQFLLNNLDILFTVYKQDDRFLLQTLRANDNNVYRLKVHNIRLYVKTVDVQHSMNVAVLNALEKTSAKYPLRKTEIRSCFLTVGRTEFVHNLFTNVVPRRLIIGMVNNHAYTGDYTRDPFRFEPFDLREIVVNASGMNYPMVPYMMNWDGASPPVQFVRAYIDMLDGCEQAPNTTNGITLEQYIAGWTFFVVTLTSSLEDSDGFELVRNGTTTVSLKFNRPIPNPGVSLICLGEFDQLLSIDRNRVVVTDGSV